MNPTAAVHHLKTTGLTEKAIAATVGANQSTINRIANGACPTWELGQALIQLAAATQPPDPDDPDAGRIGPPEEVA